MLPNGKQPVETAKQWANERRSREDPNYCYYQRRSGKLAKEIGSRSSDKARSGYSRTKGYQREIDENLRAVRGVLVIMNQWGKTVQFPGFKMRTSILMSKKVIQGSSCLVFWTSEAKWKPGVK